MFFFFFFSVCPNPIGPEAKLKGSSDDLKTNSLLYSSKIISGPLKILQIKQIQKERLVWFNVHTKNIKCAEVDIAKF